MKKLFISLLTLVTLSAPAMAFDNCAPGDYPGYPFCQDSGGGDTTSDSGGGSSSDSDSDTASSR